MTEDKITARFWVSEILVTPLSAEDRVRIQGELSIINAKIKAINTTTAAQLKAAADRRKVAGLAEAQANAARARANAGLPANGRDFEHHYRDDLACPACGTDSSTGCIEGGSDDNDPGQTTAIDSWIDAVLLRHDIEFTRDAKGHLMVTNDPRRTAPMEPNLAAAIELLVRGVYAACRGQELPDLPSPPPKAPKATPAPKASAKPAPKPKKR
jgi:hypothetical protein